MPRRLPQNHEGEVYRGGRPRAHLLRPRDGAHRDGRAHLRARRVPARGLGPRVAVRSVGAGPRARRRRGSRRRSTACPRGEREEALRRVQARGLDRREGRARDGGGGGEGGGRRRPRRPRRRNPSGASAGWRFPGSEPKPKPKATTRSRADSTRRFARSARRVPFGATREASAGRVPRRVPRRTTRCLRRRRREGGGSIFDTEETETFPAAKEKTPAVGRGGASPRRRPRRGSTSRDPTRCSTSPSDHAEEDE